MNIATQQLIKQMAADIEALKTRLASVEEVVIGRIQAKTAEVAKDQQAMKVLSLKRG